jgi:branched-chain amino acid transport system substrate-binding protein
MRKSRIGALLGVAVLTVACSQPNTGATNPPASSGAPSVAPTSAAPSGGTAMAVKVAIDLPLQGSELAGAQPIINGAKLALKQAGGKAGSWTVELPDALILDDALNGVHDPQTGAQNVTTIISDTSVVAMLGPLNSNVARAQIPLTNAAGLFQCSPANTNEGLTKPEFGALEVRKEKPDQINYIRVATTDDLQGPANAKYLGEDLGVKNLYIIDDTETFGAGIAKQVETYWKDTLKLTVVGHDSVVRTTTDYASILTTAKSKNPDGIYFGGVTASGGARILNAAVQVGLGEIPYMGPDGINDGTGETPDSFLNLTGANAKNSYSTLAGKADFPGLAQFTTEYTAEFGIAPTGYAIQGYTCMQIMLDAIGRASATNPADEAAAREAVRAQGVDTAYKYNTAMGEITFDQNGDTSQKTISVYAVDPAGANGKGAWVPKKEITFDQ